MQVLGGAKIERMSEGEKRLTVSQAAAILSVSERTVRRRCESGKLDAHLVTTESGKVWEIEAAAVEGADAAANKVRPTAAIGAATIHEGADTQSIAAANTADAAATEVRTGAANAADTQIADDARDELITELREQTSYLRGQIEAQRLQIEAANRQASEAHAALREALKMSNRALPASEIVPANPPHDSAPQVLAADANAAQEQPPGRAPRSAADYTPQLLPDTKKSRDQKGLRSLLLRLLRS